MAKIFLVDDDVDLIQQNKMTLKGCGHDVIYAHTGEKALQMLKQEKPDVMIIDVMMESHTAGLDLAQNISNTYPELPLILMTGAQQRAHWQGKDNSTWDNIVKYLDKPVAPDKLVKIVDEVLKK